jgi:hypothetical protein
MAFSFQPFSPLANVQPITLGGLDVSQIRPITPFAVGNTRPELVAQGIASGTKDIALGILTGVKAAREQKLQDLKDQRDLAKEVIKLKAAREDKQTTLAETMRHHKELERLSQERIKNVTPPDWGGDSSETTDTEQPLSATQPLKTPTSTLPTQDRYQRDTTPVGGFSFDTINLPEDLNNDSNLIQADKILGDLNYPVPLETSPTPLGMNAVNALANVDWSSVRANLGAGLSAGATPASIPATIPSFAKAKPPVSLSTLGGVSNEQMSQIQQQLAEMPLKSVSPVAAPKPDVTKFGVPKSGFKTYEEARKYIESQSGNPNWYAEATPKPDKSGMFVIPWKQQDPSKAQTQEMQKKRLSKLDQAGLASEVDKFYKDPIYKLMQSRPMQITEFSSLMDEAYSPNPKKSRRAIDLDAIDKFVMFARGTQPTEAQYSEIQNWTQGYLNDVRQKIDKGVEGARLSDADYESMMNLMYRAYNTTAELVNPEIADLRTVVKAKHPDLMEQELPSTYMPYEVPSYFEDKMVEAQQQMKQYHALMQDAKNKNDATTFAEAKKKYDEAKSEQDNLNNSLTKSKASRHPLNKKAFRRGGWRQGLFGGSSDIGAALQNAQ